MSTRELYEETIDWMKDLLQHTIGSISDAYDATYNYYNSQPLFHISSRELVLLKQVDHFCNYQIRDALAMLCKKLAEKYGHQVIDDTSASDVDFYELRDGEKIGYFISMQEMDMPKIEHAVEDGLSKHIVIVAKNNLINLPNNSFKYRAYPYKNMTCCITLEEYFNGISPGEFNVFQEYIGRFNYDAEIMLGLVVSPIPTKKAIQEKREKVISEFDSFFFRNALPNAFTSEELDYLKERFQNCGIFQLPYAPFVDSFVSSEWYFDLLSSTDGEMEQTAIVAGYLKAIEQFLFSLMLSRSDDLVFKLKTQKDNKLVVLTKDNQSSLLSMANNLLTSIDINYESALDKVYVNEIFGYTVQSFLHSFFTYTRNGYFHKVLPYNKTGRQTTFWRDSMDRPITTLFMLMSVDGKISTGATDDLDIDKDFPKIAGVREGLHQYYEIEQTTDLWSLNSGRVQAKLGVNTKEMPDKTPVSFVIIDNDHLNKNGVLYFCSLAKEFVLITSNANHPAFDVDESNLHIIRQNGPSLKEALAELKSEYGCERITIQSGGTLNSLFLHEKLFDYIDIVIAPVLIGGKDTPTLIDGKSLLSESELSKIGVLKLQECMVLKKSYLRLRYKVIH